MVRYLALLAIPSPGLALCFCAALAVLYFRERAWGFAAGYALATGMLSLVCLAIFGVAFDVFEP